MDHPLKSFRAANSMTQEELARLLGRSRITINRWERGKRKISEIELPEVSAKTGIPRAQLRPDLAALLAEG